MNTLRVAFKFITNCSLAVLTSLYISGCQPSLPSNTQIFEVNGAKACDQNRMTPMRQDDCNYSGAVRGYYYGSGDRNIFYRGSDGEKIVIERNRSFSNVKPGGIVPLQNPVITDSVGVPLMNGSEVLRSPSAIGKSSTIRTSPIRSSASFNHPSLGRVNSGKTTSSARGMSFGGRGFSG